MTVVTIFVILISLTLMVRPFTTVIHELGHAIPALILTNDRVSIYIGSYGDPENSIYLKIFRLEIFFKYNPFLWSHGLCVIRDQEVSINNNILITILGPIASMVMGIFCIFFIFEENLHGSLKIIGVFIFLSSVFDFLINIIPNKQPLILHDGSIAFNDGQSIVKLLRYKSFVPLIEKGIILYNGQDYEKSAELFQDILDQEIKYPNLYRLTISSYLLSKKYKEALEVHNNFENAFKLNSDDYSNSGLIKSYQGKLDEGLIDFEESLKLNPHSKNTLNNRGYLYNLRGEYEKAIIDFDKAIKIDGEAAYPYNNRGLAKIKLGKEEEGLNDIKKSIELDDTNSYAYRNMGIYHFDKGELNKAKNYFKLAYKLDSETHLLQDYFQKLKNMK